VVPAVPVIAARKPAWLVAAEADLKADPWLGIRPFGGGALAILGAGTNYRHDGVDPLRYDREIRAELAQALAEGEAVMAGQWAIVHH
jgi:hypothetical protein